MASGPRKSSLWIPDRARAADLVAAFVRVTGRNPNLPPAYKRPTAVGRALGLHRNTVRAHLGHRLPPFDKSRWRPIDVDLLPLRLPVAAKVLATHLRGQQARQGGSYRPSAADLAHDLRWPLLRVKRALGRLNRAGVIVELRLRWRGSASLVQRTVVDDYPGSSTGITFVRSPEGPAHKGDTGQRTKVIPASAQKASRPAHKSDTGMRPSVPPHSSQYRAMSLPPDPPLDLAELADRLAAARVTLDSMSDVLSDEFRSHLRDGPDAAALYAIATAAGIFDSAPAWRWRAALAWVRMGWTTEAALVAVKGVVRASSQGRPVRNPAGLLRSRLDSGPHEEGQARSRLGGDDAPSGDGSDLGGARAAELEAADRWATRVAHHRDATMRLSRPERLMAARALRRDLTAAIERLDEPREPRDFLADHCRTLAELLAFCELYPALAPPDRNGDPGAR